MLFHDLHKMKVDFFKKQMHVLMLACRKQHDEREKGKQIEIEVM